MSVPIATWTVTGMPSLAPAARMLKSLYGYFDLFMSSPTDLPIPQLFFRPFFIALFSNSPVSFAMPNEPLPISASTSSLVIPAKAISKSWTMHAPFIATAFITPISIKSIITGDKPTFITCAPMPTPTGLLLLCALTTAAATSFKFFTARILGSELRKSLKLLPCLTGMAKSWTLTLLFLVFNEYVLSLDGEMGLNLMHDNRLSLAASPLEQDMVYQVTDYMPGCNMNLLNPWSNIGIHIEQYIHHLGHFTAALACQTDGFNTHIPRHLYCRNDIL